MNVTKVGVLVEDTELFQTSRGLRDMPIKHIMWSLNKPAVKDILGDNQGNPNMNFLFDNIKDFSVLLGG